MLVVLCGAAATAVWVPPASRLVLLFLGVTLVAGGAAPLLRGRALRHWRRHSALLTHVDERRIEMPMAGSLPRRFRLPVMRYRYRVQDQTYAGDQVSLDPQSTWVGETDAWGDLTPDEYFWWRQFHAGDQVSVYVDPRDPRRAVLLRRPQSPWQSGALALLAGGAVLIGLWLLLALLAVDVG